MIKIILTIMLSTSMAFAECPKNVQVIKKGQAANCDGFLFSPETEKKASEAIDDAKYYKDLNLRLQNRKELTDKEIEVLDKRLQLYVEQCETLAERLNKRENQNKWERVLWFTLGIAVTGLAVHGASQLDGR